ncbi:MAG: class I SAM-dependent methyltransferase [Pseudomonadota bacterium]
MAEQAPYSYIADYYESVQVKNAAFPDIAEFWLNGFRHVTGESVLNLGCGPMFYDNAVRFGEPPSRYVGLDLNASTFDFLEQSDHPTLVKNREICRALGIETEFIAGDVFDHVDTLSGRFDTVLGIGFFGTFSGDTFDALLRASRQMLKPEGRLLKMTWHGAQRSDAQREAKLKYRYDNDEEPSADDLICLIEAQGFSTVENDVLICPPDTVGWDAIQVALFTPDDGALKGVGS